jgi:hypothetical protein
LTPVASITFVTPLASLVGLAAALPLVAYTLSSRRSSRARVLLGLAPASSDRALVAALVSVPLLLGIAAAGPALRTHSGRRIRTDAQAIFILDTSRSMAAAESFRAPTRLEQAQAAAIRLRDDAIPDVASGAASLTTELLPHLLPSPDLDAFDSTVRSAMGVEKPPPPFLLFGVKGTSFGPLFQLRGQGFFNPTTTHRLAILLTDGESGAIDAPTIGKALTLPEGYPPPSLFRGLPSKKPEPPVSLFIIRVGSKADRIYNANGTIEKDYRPDPTAADTVDTLAAAAHGRAFTTRQLGEAGATLRQALGSGGRRVEGIKTNTFNLAPFFALAALISLGLVIWQRNTRNL